MKITSVILAIAALCLFGCATAERFTDLPMQRYDRDTKYRIDETPGGYTVNVYYSRFQYIPESSAVAMAAKSAIMNIAHDHADKKGRKIEPINEQRIRMSMGRNGLAGITSWTGTLSVKYR